MTMNDLNQEPEMLIDNNNQEELQEDSIDFSLLRLNSFKSSPNHHHQQHSPCNTCGCTCLTNPTTTTTTTSTTTNNNNNNNPMKRPSPENPTSNSSEPKSKKLFLEPPQQDNFSNFNLHGFSKITLPLPVSATTQTPSFPVLRRCISDPCTPPTNSFNPPQSPPENAKVMAGNVVTPSSSSAAKGSSSALPPLPPTLRRSISDPISSSPAKTFSRSSSSNPNEMNMEESPNYKRLKRMKDCVREISQWWDVIMREDEDEDAGTEVTNNATQDDAETEYEEDVSVERAGDNLIVHFKCPCGKGYHILLSGRSCYYKLV